MNGRRSTETNEASGRNEADYFFIFFGTRLISVYLTLRWCVKPWLEKFRHIKGSQWLRGLRHGAAAAGIAVSIYAGGMEVSFL